MKKPPLSRRIRTAILFTGLLLFGCAERIPVQYIVIEPGCPPIPDTVFRKYGIDAKLGASSFGKIVTGDASFKITPEITSLISQAVKDTQVAEAYICAAGKRGELTTPEQFEHARSAVRFHSREPSPEQVIKYQKEFPFPKAPSTSEVISQAREQLMSQNIETRIEGINTLHRLVTKSQQAAPAVIEVLSNFVRLKADRESGFKDEVSSDLQQAMTALTSHTLTTSVSSKALLQPLNLRETNLIGIKLDYAELSMANLSHVSWKNSSLRDANLRGVNLEYAHLEESNLTNANLQGANLIGAVLDMSDLQGVNLTKASLEGAQLKGAILEKADLSDANLEQARTDGVQWEGAKICRTLGISDATLASIKGIVRC